MSRMIKKVEAFSRRGVVLDNDRWSWGGQRPDGTLVLQVWEDDFKKLGTGQWAVQIGYPEVDDGIVTDHERSRPGSRERQRHIEAIRSGSVRTVELLKGHPVPGSNPRETQGIDGDRYGQAGALITIDHTAWIECASWQDFRRWTPAVG